MISTAYFQIMAGYCAIMPGYCAIMAGYQIIMEEIWKRKISAISKSVIYKGTLRDLWKMEEDLTKNRKQLKCLFSRTGHERTMSIGRAKPCQHSITLSGTPLFVSFLPKNVSISRFLLSVWDIIRIFVAKIRQQ